jgi:disulfide bond formation protein DsbB
MLPPMHQQTDKWLFADWAIFGTHVPHWTIAIAGLVLAALLVAWFERPKRAAARFSAGAAGD